MSNFIRSSQSLLGGDICKGHLLDHVAQPSEFDRANDNHPVGSNRGSFRLIWDGVSCRCGLRGNSSDIS